MRSNIIKLLSFVSLVTFCNVSAVHAQTAPAEQQKVSPVTVSLYGNAFTIDPSFIDNANGDGVHSWQSIAQYVPVIFPNVRDPENKKSIKDILLNINNLMVHYRNLYVQSTHSLAERLEKEGHFQLLEANETDAQQLKLLKDVLPFAPAEERVKLLDEKIASWLRDGSWHQRIVKYNDFKGETALYVYPFENPYRFYQYFLAVFYLDTVVRRSPEYAEWLKTRNSK